MTKHEAFDGSCFAYDLNKLEDVLDYLECYVMYPESNPINKKDIVKACLRIRNIVFCIEKDTKAAGYSYFENPAPEDCHAMH